jgi:hypothetical protein
LSVCKRAICLWIFRFSVFCWSLFSSLPPSLLFVSWREVGGRSRFFCLHYMS